MACAGDVVTDELAPAGEMRTYRIDDLHRDPTAPRPQNEAYETFVHAFYDKVRYPKKELESLELGRVYVKITLNGLGEYTDIHSEPMWELPPSEELPNFTVIGSAETKGDLRFLASNRAFAEEVKQAVQAIGTLKPAKVNGEDAPSQIEFAVKFFPE